MFRQRLLIARNYCKKQCEKEESHHGYAGGIPGNNFPLNFGMNKYKLTAVFTAFFGVGLGAPWLLIKYVMTK